METTNLIIPAHVSNEQVVDFDIYNPMRGGTDYFGTWKAFQEESAPIVWTVANGGHWIATRGAIIREIFEDFAHFSSKVIFAPRARGEIRLLPVTADPPLHRSYRALMNKSLSPAAIRLMEQTVRDSTIALVERIQANGHCDFIEDFAKLLPIGVFFQMANLPTKDQAQLGHWMEQIMRPDGSMTQEEAMAHFSGYLIPYIHQRRKTPGTDILSALVSGQIEGRDVTDDEAIQLCTSIVLGGLDTVITLMSFVMWHLAQSLSARRYLIDQPRAIGGAVEELCRRFPVGTNARLVQEDYLFHGVFLKRDDLISMPQILHALDGSIYSNPLEVDFRRNTADYCTFGHGVHRCPGAFLAKTEIRILIEEWLRRIPEFEIQPGTSPTVTTGITSGIFELPLQWSVNGQRSRYSGSDSAGAH